MKRKQAMVVRTVHPTISVTAPVASKQGPIKKISSQIPKPAKKKPAPSIQEDLLAKLTKNLNALQTPQNKKSAPSSLILPKPILCKPEIENSSEITPSYAENLIALLKTHLDLPEFGAVKIYLQINSSGSLIDCKILEEKSHKNSEFLKNRLHELTFPCFNDFGLSDSQLEFTIVFRNVEKQ
jgi:hypothetical protein